MDTQLYIPKRIKVGYVKRDDTYSKKLAYIIYWDDKGKLRKETSWESWRDKKIEPEEFDNKPQSGLVLHKDIKRYNWGNFSSKRTMIRVYDPRGIEFEITTENLIGVLMNTDCSKRGLIGDFVYAWSGPELVLLPTNAEEYEKASQYTALQAGKVSAKGLVPGCVYRTKKQEDFIYVGRYLWYTWESESKYSGPYERESEKLHIFTPVEKKKKEDYYFEKWITKSSLESFASKVTEDPVENFSDIIESFGKESHSAKIVKWEVIPCEISTETKKSDYKDDVSLKRSIYFSVRDNIIYETAVSRATERKNNANSNKAEYTLLGYQTREYKKFDLNTQILDDIKDPYNNYHYSWDRDDRRPVFSQETIQKQGLGDLYVTFDNGRRIKADSINL